MIVGILGCGAIANIIVQNVNTDDTNIEIKYFYDCLYKKSVYLQKALGKDERLTKTLHKQVTESIK